MKRAATVLLSLSCGLAGTAYGQRSVPIADEPHHHLVFADALLHVFRVVVPAHSSTLLHEHAVDYFWIAVGPSEFVSAEKDGAEQRVVAADGSVHYTRGGFAHLARIDGDRAFRNVTLELPQAQTNPRNLCEAVLADLPLDCAAATIHAAAVFSGASVRPEFETDQVRVTLVTMTPGANLSLARRRQPVMLVSVDDATGSLPVTCAVAGSPRRLPLQSRSGNTYRLTGRGACSVRNATRSSVRFLAIEFSAGAR